MHRFGKTHAFGFFPHEADPTESRGELCIAQGASPGIKAKNTFFLRSYLAWRTAGSAKIPSPEECSLLLFT